MLATVYMNPVQNAYLFPTLQVGVVRFSSLSVLSFYFSSFFIIINIINTIIIITGVPQ